MPNDRLPKKLLFGEVKGLCPPGRPRCSFNDVTLLDCQNCRISRPYRGYTRQAALERQDLSCMYLAHHELESVIMIVIIIIINYSRAFWYLVCIMVVNCARAALANKERCDLESIYVKRQIHICGSSTTPLVLCCLRS